MARASTRVTNPRLRGSQRQKAHFRNGAGLVNGFGQAKNTGEELFTGFQTPIQKLTFSFHCIRTSGLRDTPCPGFVLPSVVSLKAATLCLVQIWSWVPISPAYSTLADN